MKKSAFHSLVSFLGTLICLKNPLLRLLPGVRRNVMVMKIDRLGDLLLFLPYMRKIKAWYEERNCRVSILIRPELRELAERAEIADKIIGCPAYRNPVQWTLFRLGFWLGNRIDIAVNASCLEDELIFCSHPEKQVSVHLGDGSQDRNAIDVSEMSIREWNEAILQTLGITGSIPDFDYDIFCDPVPPEWKNGTYVAVCAEANDPKRCWEPEKFAELINRISGLGRKVVLIGTDHERGEKLLSNGKQSGHSSLNLCGKTTIFQLCTVIRDAELLISNETGSAHIGALTGTRTVIICGKGDYGIFVPYGPELEGKQVFSIFSDLDCSGCHWRKPRKECMEAKTYRCISEITVERVWKIIQDQVP